MNLSLGEFQSLVAKAFRGAGYPWGLTEEAAFAARQLAAFGLPAGEMMVRLLDHVAGSAVAELMPDENWQPLASGMCPVCVGVTIADEAEYRDLALGLVFEPAIIAPFLAGLATADQSWVIEWGGGSCEVTTVSAHIVGAIPSGPVAVTIRAERTSGDPSHHSRVELDAATFGALGRYAHRTYAPATEASRLAGAGAGKTDND